MAPKLVIFASAVAAVSAAFVGWKLGEWIREKIPPDSFLGKHLNKDVEEQLKASAKGVREQLEFTANMLQKRMVDQKLPGADKGPTIPFSKQSDLDLQDSVRHMRSVLDAEAIANKARAAKLVQESTDLAKHQEQIADQILARARARMHGAIFGINDKYASDLKELSGNAKQLAKVFEAMGPDKTMQLYDRGIRRRLAPMLDGDRRRLELAYSLLFTSRQFRSLKASVRRFTNVSSPLRSHTRGS